MRKLNATLFAVSLLFTATLYGAQKNVSGALYQLSTLNALIEGVYDGDTKCGELKTKGDFGIGTFNALDGEMIVVNGKVYKVRSDGKTVSVPDSELTPFAAITYFETNNTLEPESGMSLKQLQEFIDFSLPTKNIIYAVRITGTFKHVKTRSVPKQNKPYPNLVEVAKTQPVFEFKDIKGALIGFRFPQYMDGVNLPGYHLHFLSDDKSCGGHLLEVTLDKTKIETDDIHSYTLVLPDSEEFYRADISKKDGKAEIVEKQAVQPRPKPKPKPKPQPKKTEEEYH